MQGHFEAAEGAEGGASGGRPGRALYAADTWPLDSVISFPVAGHFEAAERAAGEAVAAGVPGAPVERAKLLWAMGKPHRALIHLQQVAWTKASGQFWLCPLLAQQLCQRP